MFLCHPKILWRVTQSLGHVISTLNGVNYLLPSDFLAAFVTLPNRQECLVSSFGCNIHGYRRLVNRYEFVLYMCVCVYVALTTVLYDPITHRGHGTYAPLYRDLLFSPDGFIYRKTFVAYQEEIYNFLRGGGRAFSHNTRTADP